MVVTEDHERWLKEVVGDERDKVLDDNEDDQ